MRKLLNILYVTVPDAYLSRDGDNVVVKVQGVEKARFPIHNLEGIVCFSYVGTSPALMSLCCDKGVPIAYLSEHGRFLARVTGRVSGNVLLRRQQYRMADDPSFRALTARRFVTGKLMNCRSVLLRFMRDHGHKESISRASNNLLWLSKALQTKPDLESIRGVEGEGAREYYAVFDEMVLGARRGNQRA